MSFASGAASSDALDRISSAQVHEMRECFQVLDRDNDGRVTKEDVQEAYMQIGKEPSAADMAPFFQQGSQTMNLSNYLTSLTTPLSKLSSAQELLAAFAAFDTDDSGQIDIHVLRDAMLNTIPERTSAAMSAREVEQVLQGFTGQRAFAKGMGADAGRRGEVFRYTEFVQNLTGSTKDGNQARA